MCRKMPGTRGAPLNGFRLVLLRLFRGGFDPACPRPPAAGSILVSHVFVVFLRGALGTCDHTPLSAHLTDGEKSTTPAI